MKGPMFFTVPVSVSCCALDWLLLSGINMLIIRTLESRFPDVLSNWLWMLYQDILYTGGGWFNPVLIILLYLIPLADAADDGCGGDSVGE